VEFFYVVDRFERCFGIIICRSIARTEAIVKRGCRLHFLGGS